MRPGISSPLRLRHFSRMTDFTMLKESMVADNLKQSMSDDLHRHVLQGKTARWLQANEILVTTANFEDSQWASRRDSVTGGSGVRQRTTV